MTLVARKRAHSTTYYAVLTYAGDRVWENVGTDKREAQRAHTRLQADIKHGRFVRKVYRGGSVGDFIDRYLETRHIRSEDDERRHFELHVLPRKWLSGMRMDAVRPVHMLRLVEELKSTVSEATGKPLSPKSIANIWGSVRTMFRYAARVEAIDRDPCLLERGAIKRGRKTQRLPYDFAAIRKLLTCEDVPTPSRVFAALAFFTGMREGEICGRRWRDWDPNAPILGSLTVDSQYDGRPLKTEDEGEAKPRRVPVHPFLATLLRLWRDELYELHYCERPEPDAFIVRARDGAPFTMSSGYKAWRRALAIAGVANLTLHSTRHTFITLCRRGGAPKDVVERITHNAQGDIVDQYTHYDWTPLCQAVLCLPFSRSVDVSVDTSRGSLLLTVEAAGIETAAATGPDKSLTENAEDPPPRGEPRFPLNPAKLPLSVARVNDASEDVQDAPLPSTLVGVRLEVDGLTARCDRLPGDTTRTLADRLRKTLPLLVPSKGEVAS